MICITISSKTIAHFKSIAKPDVKVVPSKPLILLFALSCFGNCGCGHWPSGITSRRDIKHTSRNETHIEVSGLATEEFKELAKFQNLFEIDLEGGATDDQLEILAADGFPRLGELVLEDCPLVTDRGVSSLARISALRVLGLRRASITDASCDFIANRTMLADVSLPNCPRVTSKGLIALAQSPSIEELGISLAPLSQAELVQIINSARRLKRIDIESVGDDDKRLNLPQIREAAAAKGITIFIGERFGLQSKL